MRKSVLLIATVFLFVFSSFAFAKYPDRVITLIVPVPPGGAGDYIARQFGNKLSEALQEKVVIDNRGGAAGTIAANAVAKATPDGYTLLLSSSTSHGTAPVVYKNIPYDAVKQFTHIGMIGTVPAVLSVNTNVPVRSVAELVKYAQDNPGKLNYGSSGLGSPLQFWAEMFMSAAHVKLVHVPYKGAGPAALDLLGGRIHMMFDGLPSQLSGIHSGALRPIAALSMKRSELLPDVPTMGEVGYPTVLGGLWFGLSGPADLPLDVVKTLSDALQKVVAMPDFQESLKKAGILTTPLSAADYADYIKKENERYGKIAQEAHISVE